MDVTSRHAPRHRLTKSASTRHPDAQPAQPAPPQDGPDDDDDTAAWLDQLHDDGQDLEQTGITPEQSGICGYCQRPLSDGESHLHNGWLEDNRQRPADKTWADAAVTYAASLETAFNEFQQTDRLAWDIYIAAREAADRRFEQAKVTAGLAWQQAISGLMTA